MKDKIEFIAFDADDTLWESELYIQEFEHKFCNLLRQYLPASSISQRFFETEMKNLHMYGYGLKSIMLSMTETICKVTDGNGNMHLIEDVIGWTRASAETGYTTGRREGDHIVTSWEI